MLNELIHYTQVADGRLIAVFQNHTAVNPAAIDLFNHVLNAQHIWASRMLGIKPKYTVWEKHGIELFAIISKENFDLLQQVVENVPLESGITYAISSGKQYTNLVKDILFHVVNHSTYHRAQIATLFKANEISPPITDYIMLVRDHQL